MISRALPVLACGGLLAASCGSSDPARPQPAAPSTPMVVVSTYPLEYFTTRMAGGMADIVFPVHPDASPARWRPQEGDLELLQDADLVLTNGATYEQWTQYVTLPGGRLRNTSAGFRDEYVIIPDAVRHHHGDGNWHTHDATASVTWLDPIQAIQQAASIRAALVELLPHGEEEINRRHGELEEDLRQWHRQNLEALQPLRGVHLLSASHDFQYLARRYRLDVSFLSWATHLPLDEAAWEELDAVVADNPAQWLLWRGEPTEEARDGLGERGISIIALDIASHEPPEGDFLDAMAAIREALAGLNERAPRP